eukprot:2537806-Pyramimonas_sp.AAC.1
MGAPCFLVAAAVAAAAVNFLSQAVSPLSLPSSLVLLQWINGSVFAPGTFRPSWDRCSRTKILFGKSSGA